MTSGSHVDTVPDGGRYDGALGTVLALELAQELREGTAGGARPALLVCAAEEAPRFGAGTIGSRLLAGTLDDAGARRSCTTPAGSAPRAPRAAYLDELVGAAAAARAPGRARCAPTSRSTSPSGARSIDSASSNASRRRAVR